ncbi:phage tail protein [Haloarcula sp. 1CSR25-25]|uniref:phage tail protein n=1 Tax=Haloarcula sp. 1CSR25-25 TaxID=2862545 RepID=UPI002895E317|nr:phage tail protein [Haloarcula sp. 1CSR25-25]MDT3435975.1 hypothetical protein [Haloarcula sp. 1CSR25-25]
MSDFAFLGSETAAEWAEWSLDNAVTEEGAVRLRRERLPAYVDPDALIDDASAADPVVDLDVDDCETLYILRASGYIERFEADSGRPVRLGCASAGPPDGRARALTVTAATIYVAGTRQSGDGYVTAIAKSLQQQRWTTPVTAETPVALTDSGDWTVCLLSTQTGGRLALVRPDGTLPTLVDGFSDPTDVAVDAAGTGAFLDQTGEGPVVRRVSMATLDPDAPTDAPSPSEAPVPAGASCLAAGAADELLVGRRDTVEGEVTAFRVTGATREALASVTRTLDRLHHAGDLYAVTSGGGGVLRLTARPEYAQHERTGTHAAWLERTFDSGVAETEWHRVTMGFSNAAATQVRLQYTTSDDQRSTRPSDWKTVDPANPHDALLADAVGRYLRLRVELQGDRFASPQLHTLRAYFPRDSYLRHLPGIYQDDTEARAFFERFLSIFESTFVGVEEELAHTTRYLDPDGVPPAFLGWLEDWLALAPDETWPESARRELLSAAPELFKARGTPNGLLALVALYLDGVADPSKAWEERRRRQLDAVDAAEDRGLPTEEAETLRRRIESDVFMLEFSDLDCAEGPSRAPFTELLDCPQCFFVFVRPFVSDEQFDTIQRLVDEHSPAHAVGRAVELESSVVLGGHSYLGVNSVLPDQRLAVGESALGRESVLDTRETAGQLTVRSRLGSDTELS